MDGCARLLVSRGPRSVWPHSVLKHPLAVGPRSARPAPRPPRELRAERVHTARVLLNPPVRYALNDALPNQNPNQNTHPSPNPNLSPSPSPSPSLNPNPSLSLSLRAK